MSAIAQPQMDVLPISAAVPAEYLVPFMAEEICQDDTSLFTLVTGSASREINDGNGTLTDARSMGFFNQGNVTPGTSLNDAVDPAAVFAGGVGFAEGICLCTGLLDDSEIDVPGSPFVTSGLAIGVQGPNNGFPIDEAFDAVEPVDEGEVSVIMTTSGVRDADFDDVHGASGGGDPAVIEFQITLVQPGFLQATFVFGSDEHPHWTSEINDSLAILIRNDSSSCSQFVNIATLTVNDNGSVSEVPFSLQQIRQCPVQFLENRVAPSVRAAFPDPRHDIPGAPYYDHEFGGASRPLTRESIALPPGTYTVKFVVQDVTDRKVDSALFIKRNSLTLFPVSHGDYNLDGVVDSADYTVWASNYTLTCATFEDGDGNGNGVVDLADYNVWRDNLGASGNGDFTADFNRDGVVDAADYTIWQDNDGIATCASRYEGDADGDGDVDDDDYE